MIKRYKRYNNQTPDIYWILLLLSAIAVAVKHFLNINISNNFIYIAIILFLVCILGDFFYKKISKYIRRKKYLNSTVAQIDKMSGKQFEIYLQAFFEKQGYRVFLTKDSCDYGADLVMKKDGITTIVQAKRYNKKVGIEAIQQIVAAKAYYNADECIVATNSYFTASASKLSKANKVQLLDRNYFFDKKEMVYTGGKKACLQKL